MQRPVIYEHDSMRDTAERCEVELQTFLSENVETTQDLLMTSEAWARTTELSRQFEAIYGLVEQSNCHPNALNVYRLGWEALSNTVTLYNPTLFFDFNFEDEEGSGLITETNIVVDQPYVVRYMRIMPGMTTDKIVNDEPQLYYGPHLVVEVPASEGIRTSLGAVPPGFYTASLPLKDVIVDSSHTPADMS